MTYTIKLRRGVASDWTAVNPILAEGELGYELDTRYFKVGDGVTAWNALPYTVDEDQYLPDASLEDDGKILITFGGNWLVAEPPSGLPDPTGLPDGKMLITSGEEWIVSDVPATGSTAVTTEYVTTADQDEFTLPSDATAVRVYRNGLLQSTDHYTLVDDLVTLDDPCGAGERITIIQGDSSPEIGYVTEASLNEKIDDRVAAFLVEGENINLTYDDVTNELTVTAVMPDNLGGAGWPPANPDNPPYLVHAKNDEFENPATLASDWIATPSAASLIDIDTTEPGRLHIESVASSSALRGAYKTVPSFPFIVTAKLAEHSATGGSSRTGIFLGPTGTILNSTGVYHLSWVQNSGVVQRVQQQLGGTFGSNGGTFSSISQPLYLQFYVASATAVALRVSNDGWTYTTIENLNPGFTPGIVGLYVSSESYASVAYAEFEWIRWVAA